MPAETGGRFRYWRDPLFLSALALYFLNRAWIKPHLHTYSFFFHGHLNDFLLVPVALPLFLYVYHRLGLRPDNAPPRGWEIALHLGVWAFFFEWVGPHVLHRGIGDPVDVASYVLGGVLSWLFWQWNVSRVPSLKRVPA